MIKNHTPPQKNKQPKNTTNSLNLFAVFWAYLGLIEPVFGIKVTVNRQYFGSFQSDTAHLGRGGEIVNRDTLVSVGQHTPPGHGWEHANSGTFVISRRHNPLGQGREHCK